MFIAHTKDTMSTIYLDAVKIRQQVFVNEQQVPYELEVDAYEAYTIHFVLYQALETPVATVRLLPLEDGKVKVQRMAVLKEFRSQGFGKAIMKEAEKFAAEQGFQQIVLGAQLTAIPFYEQLGYQIVGEEFLDAGIAHLMMEKPL
ncbi:GNAT family N-acetyltransferase [Enterococcus saccharolyticus]|uniref:GNAT family acetyltransferase n=1 Tax=Candidatus Enterococcus willemsii TaxID=1857215 RepID=A0ABQ6Z1M9_9ENTE|nr:MULTISPECIES: GNAT family N-acetyltransferase [Enterococcus]KAF1305407.1 GNAT family acetyltransferase [Enterococcus sp. CU12B]MCD5001052.1 GNAT family N-acetyltransferase [Enterococcus saccharolyticus]